MKMFTIVLSLLVSGAAFSQPIECDEVQTLRELEVVQEASSNEILFQAFEKEIHCEGGFVNRFVTFEITKLVDIERFQINQFYIDQEGIPFMHSVGRSFSNSVVVEGNTYTVGPAVEPRRHLLEGNPLRITIFSLDDRLGYSAPHIRVLVKY
jgi:hypothetical protein